MRNSRTAKNICVAKTSIMAIVVNRNMVAISILSFISALYVGRIEGTINDIIFLPRYILIKIFLYFII